MMKKLLVAALLAGTAGFATIAGGFLDRRGMAAEYCILPAGQRSSTLIREAPWTSCSRQYRRIACLRCVPERVEHDLS